MKDLIRWLREKDGKLTIMNDHLGDLAVDIYAYGKTESLTIPAHLVSEETILATISKLIGDFQ